MKKNKSSKMLSVVSSLVILASSFVNGPIALAVSQQQDTTLTSSSEKIETGVTFNNNSDIEKSTETSLSTTSSECDQSDIDKDGVDRKEQTEGSKETELSDNSKLDNEEDKLSTDKLKSRSVEVAEFPSTSQSGNSTLYSNEIHSGTLSIHGENLQNSLIDSYFEITVSNQFIASLSVPQSSIIKSSELKDNQNGTSTLRIVLNEVNPTTSASFPYNLSFKSRLTPNGYELTPDIKYYKNDGSLIGTPSGETHFKVKYESQEILKYVISNQNESNKEDNVEVYTGGDVTFQYKLRTEVNRDPASYPNGIYKYRLLEKLKVTDVLPEYTTKDGGTAVAVFDPQKNPGWTLEPDGKTVSYVVNSSSDDIISGGAGKELTKVKLVLSCPNAKNSSLSVNEVKMTAKPYNQSEKEADIESADSIKFKFSDELVGNGALTKVSNNGHILNLDPGANHLVESAYMIDFTNKSSFPMKNIVIKDGPFDSRYYIRGILSSIGGATGLVKTNQVEAVYGITEDGKKEKVDVTSPQDSNFAINLFDKETYDNVLDLVEKVKNKELSETEAKAVPTHYVKMEIQLKDSFVLNPGENIYLMAYMRLNDPYGIKANPELDTTTNTLKNTVDVTADVAVNEDNVVSKEFSASDGEKVREKEEKIVFTKSTDAHTGNLNSNVSYRLNLNLAGLSRTRKLTNPKIIDILPKGLTYSGNYTTIKQEAIQSVDVIENFNHTGHTALVYNLKDIDLSNPDTALSYYIQPSGKINEFAVPQNSVTEENNNINYAYFVSDEFSDGLPQNVASDTLQTDKYDLDNDGNSEEKLVGAKSDMNVVLPAEIRSVKMIRKLGDKDWQNFGIQTNYGEKFEYLLSTRNYGGSSINQFILYDRFDTYSNGEHNYLTQAITVPENYIVFYSQDEQPPTNPNQGIEQLHWQTTVDDYSKVTAIKIVLKDGKSINPNEQLDISLMMEVPQKDEQTIDREKLNNSFYTSRNGGQSFGETNTVYNQLPLSINVKKLWEGKGLDKITVELYRNSESNKTIKTLSLNKSNGFKGVFANLPIVDNQGKEINDYNVRESLPENFAKDYETTIKGDIQNGFVISNTRITTSLSVEKVWNDNNNQDGKRPKKIELRLFANNQEIQSQEVTEKENWRYSFNDLPKYENGQEIHYTVKEVSEVAGYTATIDGTYNNHVVITNTHTPETTKVEGQKIWKDTDDQDGKRPEKIGYTATIDGTYNNHVVITNTHTPETTKVEGQKIWKDTDDQDGKRPEKITVHLLADGKEYGKKEVTEKEGWRYSFSDLPKYEKGQEVVYTVTEDSVEGYQTTIDGYDITNSYTPGKTSMSVTKVWEDNQDQDGVRPNKVMVQLYGDEKEVGKAVELNEANKWTTTWTDLPEKAKGKEIHYTVKEVSEVAGYTATIDGTDKNHVVITNTHKRHGQTCRKKPKAKKSIIQSKK